MAIPKDDAQLIREARGEPEAFAELYRRHAPAIHSWLAARTPASVAVELTAETVAQAAVSLLRFRDRCGGSAAPWLHGIAKNLLRRYLEKERVETRARRRLGVETPTRSNADGGDSTFMVERDAVLPRYDAFRLHERIVAAAGGDREAGALCTPAELTRAESVALGALAKAAAPGANADATAGIADAAVRDAFAGAPCRGLAYASERARFVYAGIEPRSMLMPGAR